MSLYRRGNNPVWYMNIIIGDERINKSTGKTNKKEAQMVEALERHNLLQEKTLTARDKLARTLLSEAVKQVYETRWKNNKDGKQSKARAERIVEVLGDPPVGKIDHEAFYKIKLHLEAKSNKPATVNRSLEILKTLLRFTKQEWDYIKLSRVPRGRMRVITKQEEDLAVKHLRETKRIRGGKNYTDIADLVICLVDTGMRLGEMLKLRYEDVNFDTNLISIWINKGGRPRSIPMTKRVREIMLARQNNTPDMPFHLNNDQAINAWQWVRKEMGLAHDKEFVLHALRHTCASRLLNKGADIVTIRDWLGHADIATTMIYAHLQPNKLAHAAAMLDSYS